MTASENAVFAWVAIDKDRLVPSGGHFTQEVHTDGWGRCAWFVGLQILRRLCWKILRRNGEVLDGVLEKDASSKFVTVRRLACITTSIALADVTVHEAATKFHTADGVADERMRSSILSLLVGCTLREIDVL